MVMFGGLYLLIPTVTIAPPQSALTRTSNAQSSHSGLELCPAATLDCAAAKTSILHAQVRLRMRAKVK